MTSSAARGCSRVLVDVVNKIAESSTCLTVLVASNTPIVAGQFEWIYDHLSGSGPTPEVAQSRVSYQLPQ
eukprot:6478460-Amphidinium_carterae.1